MTPAPRLLISLHDVTPFHLARLRKAETLFRELGLSKVAYLFVPAYHGGHPSAEDPGFIAWCRAERPFEVQWHLHGYYHLESPDAPRGSAGEAWKRRLLTAGEGEFLALGAADQRRRLETGISSFQRCLGSGPKGFVAPAWLFNRELPPLLREMGIRHTEDQRRLYRVDSGRALPSPVITWATRTVARKYGSLLICPLLARIFSRAAYLRVALHPFDFDHAATVRSLRGVLGRVASGRSQAFPDELDFGA